MWLQSSRKNMPPENTRGPSSALRPAPAAPAAAAQGEPVQRWIERELQCLVGLLAGNQRDRRYRHHVFIQDASEVLRLSTSMLSSLKKTTSSTSSFDSDVVLQKRLIAMITDRCVVAGESCANELRLHRVDTMPVSLALLATLARLHVLWTFVVETVSNSNNNRSKGSGGVGSVSAAMKHTLMMALTTTDSSGNNAVVAGAAHDVSSSGRRSIGGLVDALMAKEANNSVKQRPSSKKRQRE